LMQDLGLDYRILRGEGEFVGEGAYEKFGELATIFYDGTPGVLVHPHWMTTKAYLVALSLRDEPKENYVAYTFEFWEHIDLYEKGATLIPKPVITEESQSSEEQYYIVVRGDNLWNIARRHGVNLQDVIRLNPQIKNPNLIYPGDRIRIR
ncbi:LysM peptidoglycan-binding domain-containing protein, partial [Clostridiaceae bacterium OttesenSCG-928-D20]|nr:LysM peptidoglycan-binding domain-containing protein [Clostridiaceae bacterium OttesenSCG-928-D20]